MKGDFSIYLEYVILGQLIPAKNNTENINDYECKENEVKVYVPLYDINTGKIWGLDTDLAFIMVRRDANEAFFSYGYDESKSNLLHSNDIEYLLGGLSQKTPFSNFGRRISSQFAKHLFLPDLYYWSKWKDSLHPIDSLYENVKTILE